MGHPLVVPVEGLPLDNIAAHATLQRMRTGACNPNWQGGKSIASNGYVIVRVGKNHHLADVRGYAYEHRLVAEAKLGRTLGVGDIVHHKNGIKTDNRPENIEVMQSAAQHRNQHRKKASGRRLFDEQNPMRICKCGCGGWFFRFDKCGRPRTFIAGHNPHDISKQEACIQAAGNGETVEQIAAKTGQSRLAVKVMTSKLVAEGKLQRISRGIYGRKD